MIKSRKDEKTIFFNEDNFVCVTVEFLENAQNSKYFNEPWAITGRDINNTKWVIASFKDRDIAERELERFDRYKYAHIIKFE